MSLPIPGTPEWEEYVMAVFKRLPVPVDPREPKPDCTGCRENLAGNVVCCQEAP